METPKHLPEGTTPFQRRQQLEDAAFTKAKLIEHAPTIGLTLKDENKAQMVDLVIGAEFGPEAVETSKIAPQDGSGASDSSQAGDASGASSDAGKGDQDVTQDPLGEKLAEIQAQLDAHYKTLVEKIKAAKATMQGTSGGDTPEQQLAGAVQFLGEATATLTSARVFVDDAAKIVAANRKIEQDIATAKADLNRRSDEYTLMKAGDKDKPVRHPGQM